MKKFIEEFKSEIIGFVITLFLVGATYANGLFQKICVVAFMSTTLGALIYSANNEENFAKKIAKTLAIVCLAIFYRIVQIKLTE